MEQMKRREAREADDRAAKYLDGMKLEDVQRSGMKMLHVSCMSCPRAGRYRVAGLIARYGAYVELGNLKNIIACDCPRQRIKTGLGGCGVSFPDLLKRTTQ